MTNALDPNGYLRLIIFDCDGVLVDSEKPSCRATAEFARSQGLKISDQEAYDRFMGKALPQIVKEMEHDLGHSLPDDTALRMRENLVQLMKKMAVPVEGAPEMIEGVRHLGVPFRVGSNSSVREMEAKFQACHMMQFFPENRVHSANDMNHPKPSPEVYLYAAKAEGVTPDSCLVIEDSDTGAEAARRAGMACVLLRAEGLPLPAFWPAPGFVRITDISQLVPLLRKTLESQKAQA
ncbi:HAD family hydrolase [Gluconobacter morbifer]|uniref:Putative phosphatase n=1 Tax=Gluconobacter morbifer G707 TaxID=1088869 RepID=G6XK93_9PROT|nr:HAD family phosphatase [Gluconobacter morbifer]EHH67689.1 putative phosphatase [Gluconobacter morbifer G707]